MSEPAPGTQRPTQRPTQREPRLTPRAEPELAPEIRRERLLLRSQLLRLQMAQNAAPLKVPLALVDQARNGLHWLGRHPEWPLAVALALLLLRPRRALGLSARLWGAWRMWRKAQRFGDGAGAALSAIYRVRTSKSTCR